MTGESPAKFKIGEWIADPESGRLLGGGEEVSLRPKVMDLLVYLAANQGTVVSADDIIDNVWDGAFVSSESVYLSINQLRKALQDDKSQPRYIETISKRGYRLIAPVERGDDGAAADSQPLQQASDPQSAVAADDAPAAGKRRLVERLREPKSLAAGLAVIFVALFAAVMLLQPGSNSQGADLGIPSKSIAVLPLVNNSSDPEQEYFSDGISEEILNMLAQVDDLKVAARTSSFQFKDSNVDVSQIGRQLRVATVLEGSVRKSGDQVRVTVQLINAEDGFHIWSQTFERELDDVFAIQDEIATETVRSLKEHLGLSDQPAVPQARIATATEAYDLYLQGRYELNAIISPDQTVPDLRRAFKARALFERALEISPEFAPAWTGLADAVHWIGVAYSTDPDNEVFAQYGPIDREKGWQEVLGYVERALELGPNLAEVQFAAGFYTTYEELDKSLFHLKKAVEINPNMGQAHANLALTYEALGEFDKAFEAADRAFRVDPLNERAVWRALYYYLYFGKFDYLDDVLEASRRVNTALGHLTAQAFVLYERGQFDQLANLQQRAKEIDAYKEPWSFGAAQRFGEAFVTLGLPSEAKHWLFGEYNDVLLMADGKIDEAIAYLEEEAEERPLLSKDEYMMQVTKDKYRWSTDVFTSLMHAYLYAGRYDDVIRLAERFPLDPEDPPGLEYPPFPNRPWPQTALIYAMRQTGDEATADDWLDRLDAVLARRLSQGIDAANHYYELARVRALQGRNDEALAALQDAVDRGWRRWYLELDPILAPVFDMPDYLALRQDYESDLEQMRDAVNRRLAVSFRKYPDSG